MKSSELSEESAAVSTQVAFFCVPLPTWYTTGGEYLQDEPLDQR